VVEVVAVVQEFVVNPAVEVALEVQAVQGLPPPHPPS
jgi:hypothetical protein